MFFPFFFDPTVIFLIPAIILAIWAQGLVSSRFAKYSHVRSSLGLTGAQLAKQLLNANGIYDVPVERITGNLTDHYDPKKKIVSLSESTYNSSSVASLGIVAHEIGHVVQDQESYIPLKLRNAIVPAVSFTSQLAWILFIIGLLFWSGWMIKIGIIFFSGAVLFSLLTLPVEFNASSRALKMLDAYMMPEDELAATRKVLGAAAMTYVAGAAMAIMQLLRMIFISRVMRS
ncbi:MAG: peptidase [Thermotoga sp.]|nr:MAG: peptidase [Thermotoga sp.]